MKKHYLTLFATALSVIVFTSCGGGDNAKSEPQEDTTAVDTNEVEMWGFDAMNGSSYQVPSPNELFGIIKSSKLPYKDGLITTAQVNYASSKTQALNFGRLTADIAYTASYEKFQESISNFDNLRKVGDDLGISYVFDELMVNRVKSNMDNSDSLEVISTSSYQNIIGMLEQNEKGSTLAIIAAGGFVESIYILTNMIDTYKDGNETIQRLADQKLVMENVLDYLNLFRDEDRVLEVLTDIQGVSDVFLNLDEVSVSQEVSQQGQKTVLGGNRIVMTADEFNALKKAATDYRNSFSNPSEG
ncbi:MAG: hypothetical protein R2813_04970 [Flavobacteriales bacterium]